MLGQKLRLVQKSAPGICHFGLSSTMLAMVKIQMTNQKKQRVATPGYHGM